MVERVIRRRLRRSDGIHAPRKSWTTPFARSSQGRWPPKGSSISSPPAPEKPDISILSEEFLAEVRDMKQRNLTVELLQKLLKGELAVRRRKNVV